MTPLRCFPNCSLKEPQRVVASMSDTYRHSFGTDFVEQGSQPVRSTPDNDPAALLLNLQPQRASVSTCTDERHLPTQPRHRPRSARFATSAQYARQ
ncbi:hypothetical protein ABMA28_000666 [Loxostege sticticalis]|uniref:Uncharacterized protein n=1 Tax=Loxostege sticticalis TaxID=481309 RepID=A0ABD0T5T0_LOXSC